MMHPQISRQLHEERLRDLERHRRFRGVGAAGSRQTGSRPGRSLRRVVGRTILRIGTAIEAEPRQPAASR
jgi:hypothetical protein